MAKSELLDTIRDDFLAQHENAAQSEIDAFCSFAADWLASAGVLGVGHTANGVALRMRDGSEKILVDLELPVGIVDTPAVAFGSGGVSARQGICGGESPSVRITGRAQ